VTETDRSWQGRVRSDVRFWHHARRAWRGRHRGRADAPSRAEPRSTPAPSLVDRRPGPIASAPNRIVVSDLQHAPQCPAQHQCREFRHSRTRALNPDSSPPIGIAQCCARAQRCSRAIRRLHTDRAGESAAIMTRSALPPAAWERRSSDVMVTRAAAARRGARAKAHEFPRWRAGVTPERQQRRHALAIISSFRHSMKTRGDSARPSPHSFTDDYFGLAGPPLGAPVPPPPGTGCAGCWGFNWFARLSAAALCSRLPGL